jgi:hypothetical protein
MTRSFEAKFGKLHAHHVAGLIRHLIECRRTFGGDLDLFLVFSIIGERSFTPRNVPESMTEQEFRASPVSTVQPVAINLQSLADYSGIPRETVRRKLAALIDMGWIERDAQGLIVVTDQAKDGLAALTQSSVRYLRDLAAAFDEPTEPD